MTIFLENARKKKCIKCMAPVYLENDTDIIFRNIAFVHIEKKTNETFIICRKCHHKMNLSNISFSDSID